ncbi:MAG: DUF2784 domain-containing protein [Proteobacteria bacterium]|nr:DUF2784 domain-containing protein [Pseudomonadota bacterium]
MLYRILADLVVLLHLLFILFVIAGGFLGLHRGWLVLLHLPAVLWGVYIEFSGKICPLTPLENHFSQLAGRQGYSSGFIERYLLPIIYPAGLTGDIQLFLGFFVLVVNLGVYFLLIRRYRSHIPENAVVKK